MILFIMIIMVTLIYITSSILYFYLNDEVCDIKNCLRKEVINIVLLVEICLLAIYGYLSFIRLDYEMSSLYKYIFVITVVLICSIIDYKEKLIPNIAVLSILIVTILFSCYQMIIQLNNALAFLINFLIGGGIAFVLFIVTSLISRGGLGAGDVKLITVIGLCVGGANILNVIFYTLVSSFVYSIYLLVFKKAKMHDDIPMAPFMYMGLLFHFITTLI